MNKNMNNNEYYNSEKISELRNLTETAFAKKTEYESLWFKIANYCGLNKYFYNEKQNDRVEDKEINNSQASISLNQSSDSMLGILIGDGNFFKIKPKDKLEELIKDKKIYNIETKEAKELILNNDNLQNYSEFVNFFLKEQFFNKDSNFIKSLHQTIKEYFAFGNAGMGVFKSNLNDINFEEDFSKSHLDFKNYSINNCAFLEGKNGDIDSIFIKYRWSAKKIVETFCMGEDGFINETLTKNIPEQILGDYRSSVNKNIEYDINYIFIKNPEKKNNVIKGRYNANYVGLFIHFDSNKILKKEYFKNKQIKIIRDNIKTGETYGKGLAGKIISEIELCNKISGDLVENIENIVRPYLAVYENVLSSSIIELDRNKPLILKSSKDNPATNPSIFPVIANGDPTSAVNVLLPILQQNIATGLKSDIFLDFNSKSDMTATETQIRNNIRNKVLFANALDFQNLLNNLIYNSYYILFKDNFYNKKDEVITYLEDNYIDWFDIEYTSELAQIAKNSEITNIMNFIQTMASVLSIAPPEKQQEVIKKIDFSKIADAVASIYNRNDFLISEEDFNKMVEEEKQAMAVQNQFLTEQAQADLTNKNAQTAKLLNEANRPYINQNNTNNLML